jgi:amino acid transporter
VFVIASLLLLDGRQLHPVAPVHRAAGQLRAGLRYAAKVPSIARPLLMMAAVGTFTFQFEVSLPLLASDTFHSTATAYSWLIGALGAGAVIGALSQLTSPRWARGDGSATFASGDSCRGTALAAQWLGPLKKCLEHPLSILI